MTVLTKDPRATLDYGFDWTAWLAGDTIATSQWTVPAGLTVTQQSFSTTGTVAWISGGVPGVEYPIVNLITTAGGRTDERTILVRVERR